MNRLFRTTALRLTAWYLLIIVLISSLFSVVVYSITIDDLTNRMDHYESQIMSNPSDFFVSPSFNIHLFKNKQLDLAKKSIITKLIYIDSIVLCIGGFFSYLLARRTLRPIEQTNDEQATFVSNASHELRTPLATMKTEIEVAKRDPNLDKKTMLELINSNLEEVNKLTTLTSNLLKLSSNNKMELTRFSFSKMVSSIVERQNKINHSRIKLNMADDDLSLNANLESIRELVTILIDNAIKYSPSDSLITINILSKNHKVDFTIENSGRGIRQEDLPYIFDRFYRGKETIKKSGQGLGLSLAKQIVELHNGELKVTSGLNQLTIFEFII